MKTPIKTVFVLGAGFTRAFAPHAPLMVDNFEGDRLEQDFERFHHAAYILALERARNVNGQINVENLMTRLDGRMPYDFREPGAVEEVALLFSGIKRAFLRRIGLAKESGYDTSTLNDFAKCCIDSGIDCLTFNYDDLFDEALWRVKAVSDLAHHPLDVRFWHPDSGYGFFCRPVTSLLEFDVLEHAPSAMLLLKLHGSTNWRVRRGYREPYSIDALVHVEEWYPPPSVERRRPPEETIELHLEEEPFIIPPTLNKSALVEEPILRTTWSLAYDVLSEAKQVVFVGYSMPVTDIAAATLFSEAIQGATRVGVVNLAVDDVAKRRIREAYERVFPRLAVEFEFRNAIEWARELNR